MSKIFNLNIGLIDKDKFKKLYPIAKNQDVIGGMHLAMDKLIHKF